ncbi:Hypothetical protein NCS54_00892500 [Fusarium falciforme]|uniref:Hypothetical protein n=1 Tax=Fusarium falciforme TaxID=195108 RepID=UPI002300C0B7|nr:Hypothetical protein NCS54_00892500 [Fusarium falciforme]WAO91454.1 Hypothetical protein NCS54_00892500 [Fusarium falciforme]
MAAQEYYDCIIVGGGIAGINAAFRFQQAFPKLSYAIVEGRDDIGGTWSLFQYPGIRSDSDLYILSFPWDPWSEDESIAKGESIMEYLRDITKKHDLDSKIRLGYKVTSANWDSGTQHWRLKPYQAHIEGLSRFKGDVLHPQFWPKDYNYQGRKVVIIGSGATAITMLPAMHQEAGHVTMLQRSPGYIISLPQTDWMRRLLRKTLPKSWAISFIRLRYILSAYLIFLFCEIFPILSRRYIQYLAQSQLPKEFSIDPHFEPKYHPWDQRLCIAPDGDFYRCLSTGKASIVTCEISTVTEDAVVLTSGESLPADLIVTATGLRLKLLGHVDVTVDNGPPVAVGDYFTWRG